MSDYSLEDILREGEHLYLHTFKKELEDTFDGQYAVIDVESKKYVVKPNQLDAIDEAKREFGDKLFYIVQVGNLKRPTVNYRTNQHAWNF
jgi:hypothetical protein